MTQPMTAGRVSPTKRRAILLLFLHGMNLHQLGRLFHLRVRVVEEVVRRASRGGRR